MPTVSGTAQGKASAAQKVPGASPKTTAEMKRPKKRRRSAIFDFIAWNASKEAKVYQTQPRQSRSLPAKAANRPPISSFSLTIQSAQSLILLRSYSCANVSSIISKLLVKNLMRRKDTWNFVILEGDLIVFPLAFPEFPISLLPHLYAVSRLLSCAVPMPIKQNSSHFS